jgi:serine/threonine protein kinase
MSTQRFSSSSTLVSLRFVTGCTLVFFGESSHLTLFNALQVVEDGEQLVGLVGSRTYMAPEVVANKPYGKPADLFSIGVIMFVLLLVILLPHLTSPR